VIATIKPRDIVGKTRRRLAVELIVELETIDKKTKVVRTELRELVLARGSTLTNLTGIGPSGAARLLVDVGDIRRFADRDRFASWNGTAPHPWTPPPESSSAIDSPAPATGGSTGHCTSWPSSSSATPTEGRVYFNAKKAAGKTPMEAMRALKRRLSNVVYPQMLADQKRREATGPAGHSGTTVQSSVTDLTPDIGSSDKPLPGPATTQPKRLVIAGS
jgi:transposase